MKGIHLGNRVSLVKRGRSILTNDGVLIAFIIINCITFIVMSLFNAAAATTIFSKNIFNICNELIVIFIHFKRVCSNTQLELCHQEMR